MRFLVRLNIGLVPFLLFAQAPAVGVVEIYGARKVPVAEIRRVVNVAPGQRLPASKAVVEETLANVPGIESASVEAVCCESGKIILYLGIAERGAAIPAFREVPAEDSTNDATVPEPVTAAYRRFLDEVNEATRAGIAGEDLSQGHSLMAYAPARAVQQTFVELAMQFGNELKTVLRTASSEDHRAMAAYVLGYHGDKKSVIEDLSYGLRDGDATVRANSARALAAIAFYSERNPTAGVNVEASLFAEMLNSPVWTDRNNAVVALVSMTDSGIPSQGESRHAGTLATVRKLALPALVEMARWKHPPHALPAYILLGRTAGIPDPELQSAWAKGRRELVIGRASAPSKMRSVP